jgi:RimJ/RimL family protein N-acetyltransferase
MDVIAFEPAHIAQLMNYGGQEDLVGYFTERDVNDLAERGPAWSGIVDGQVVACAGLIECHKFRATGWGLFAKTTPQAFMAIHRASRRRILDSGYRRIEAYVDPRSQPAMRWVKALGFKLERSYIPYFFPDGSGAMEWALYPGS